MVVTYRQGEPLTKLHRIGPCFTFLPGMGGWFWEYFGSLGRNRKGEDNSQQNFRFGLTRMDSQFQNIKIHHIFCHFLIFISSPPPPKKKEAGRPPECSFLLIYEIEISQVITSFHHHIKTWNLTIYFNALFPEVNLFHLNQLAFII